MDYLTIYGAVYPQEILAHDLMSCCLLSSSLHLDIGNIFEMKNIENTVIILKYKMIE